MVEDIQTRITRTKTRVSESLEKRFQSSPEVVETSDVFLREHIGSTLKLVVLYADLVGSTLMTRSLSVDRLAIIIQTFTQEMSIVISNCSGQVLNL
jgi:adenylate cyclase